MNIVAIILSALGSAISGAVLFIFQRWFKRRDERDRTLDERRREKDKLLFKSIKAMGDLTVANSLAISGQKVNGEMHKALADYETVDKQVYDFLISNE